MSASQMEEERWRHAEECRLRRRNVGGRIDTGIVTRKVVNWWWVNLGWELKTPLNCYCNMLLKQPPRPEVEEEFGLGIKRKPACSGSPGFRDPWDLFHSHVLKSTWKKRHLQTLSVISVKDCLAASISFTSLKFLFWEDIFCLLFHIIHYRHWY